MNLNDSPRPDDAVAFDDASAEALLGAVPSVTPREGLKDEILAAIATTPQDVRGHSDAVIDLSARRARVRRFAPIAASVLLIAGGFALPLLLDSEEGTDTVVARSTSPGDAAMHEIMGATDAVSAKLQANGASLSIVSSTSMDKAGAMVDGQPALGEGMGAQVWSVDQAGTLTSAGVIGQDPHDGVWMPFDSEASQVIVTEEPMSGSPAPTGRVLAQVKL